MSNLEFSKTSVVYSALSPAMAGGTGVATIPLNNASAPFYPQCSKIVGIKYVNGAANAVTATTVGNLPYVDAITIAGIPANAAAGIRNMNIVINAPTSSADYNGAIYQLFWVNECLPGAGFC